MPTNQEITNFWNQHQNDPSSLIGAMTQYNVNPQQVATATGQDLNSVYNTLFKGNSGVTSGDYTYMPSYVSNGGGGEAGAGTDYSVNGYYRYNNSDYNPNGKFGADMFDSNGQNTGQTTFDASSPWYANPYLPFALVAAGIAPNFLASLGTGTGAGLGSTFGVVDDTIGTTAGLTSGTTGAGLTGTGLNVAPGTGLNLASTTSSLSGLSPAIGGDTLLSGVGLTTGLTGAGTGLGLDATIGGNALLDGAGLSGGIANGTGTLLGPTITDGAYTMTDGTVVPGATSTGVVPPGTTPPADTGGTPPGGAKPPVIPPTGTGPGTGGGNPTGGTGFGLGDLTKLIGGLWDYNNQNQASKDMLDYLKTQQAKVDNLYSPGSAEYNALWDSMSRKDAAAGRNSQYGPRSVDLAARIAQIKADETAKMTTGIGGLYAAALNKGASSDASILSALGNIMGNGSGGGGLTDISKWISNLFNSGSSWSPDTTTPSNADSYTPEGGDLGQYF